MWMDAAWWPTDKSQQLSSSWCVFLQLVQNQSPNYFFFNTRSKLTASSSKEGISLENNVIKSVDTKHFLVCMCLNAIMI